MSLTRTALLAKRLAALPPSLGHALRQPQHQMHRSAGLLMRTPLQQQQQQQLRFASSGRHVTETEAGTGKVKERGSREVKRCLRIVAYDKKRDEYIRCGEEYTEGTNTATSCRFHEIGYFSRVGPGNWYNCCKSPDFEKPGCLVGPHSDAVDDAYLRGHSNDPKTIKELRQQDAHLSAKRITE